jgi:type II secretory pathway pseudopilin PulG
MNAKRAFTPVELLMVIVIVAILTALLLPSMSSSKDTANRTSCFSNLRQVNQAIRLYGDDWSDSLPALPKGNPYPNDVGAYYSQIVNVDATNLLGKVEVITQWSEDSDQFKTLGTFKISRRDLDPDLTRQLGGLMHSAESAAFLSWSRHDDPQDASTHIRVAAADHKNNVACGYKNPTLARFCAKTNLQAWVSLSACCHILLLYGLGSTDLESFPTGGSALRALTDEQTAIQTFGRSPFVRTRNGLRYFLSEDPVFNSSVGEAHRDLCLSVFATLGLPLGKPIRLKAGDYTIADLLSESVASFSLDQQEPAWTAMAFASLLPPRKAWTNRFGERTTFSQLAEHLMRTDLNSQSCAGTHILQALVEIDRADRRYSFLETATRNRLDSYIGSSLQDLVGRQERDGGWNWHWCGSIRADQIGAVTQFQSRLLVTGHLVACVLGSLDARWRPPGRVYDRATDWLRQALASAEIRADHFWICPVTHAAQAIRKEAVTAEAGGRRPNSFHTSGGVELKTN